MRFQHVVVAVAFYCLNSFAVLQTGDTVPNSCWPDADGNDICMVETVDVVRVLVYNAGYCGPCNEEMAALAPRVKEFSGKPVIFFSLSLADFNGASPSPEFLKQWQQKYSIPFIVASAKRSDVVQYDPSPGIPMDVVVDREGKLAFMVEGYDNGAIDTLFSKINGLIQGRPVTESWIRFIPFSLLP